MGSTKKYDASGGFSEQDYEQIGTTANGIKIVANKDSSKPSNTPTFSNTPNTAYAAVSPKSGLVRQITVYGKGSEKRGKAKDINTEHYHTNPINGKRFDKNEIHVHDYDENGVRSEEARKPSKKERRLLMVARYGKRRN